MLLNFPRSALAIGLRCKTSSLVRPTSFSFFVRNLQQTSKTENVTQSANQLPTFSPEELEAARLARLAGLGWISKLPEKWIPYAELSRVEKPVGTLLLLIPSFWGITMASYAIAAPLTTMLYASGLFTVGALIMRGAGCTINDILDRNLDNKVVRTVERPLASGRVSVPQAVGWLAAQCFLGLGVLLSLPFECFYLGALSLPFVFTYPLYKRYTYYPQAALSFVFSWGCLLGFPAVGAALDLWVALPLFVSNFLWCMTYDTIYAHQDKAFDIKAGIKSTALAWGEKTKPILNGLSVAQLGLFTFSGLMNGMGPGFYATAIWGFSRLFKQIKNVNLDDPKDCWRAFTGNIRTGEILWLGMIVDYILRLLGYL
ncbi:4-hydroxybenzoate polyprenyltransferase, mitochondrial [[Candida] railenensis]|uniref:4-hydroxybenzoate polyprenyltransferase, mitochondrial n=1 Tax=[Candida] railenensis TaxID=45579 RepID=A0A9P0QQT9_9ASCO|nr:4-hydroxybenzoate polyprenyltransferase, mitochondrial [[Candida] railenensis]